MTPPPDLDGQVRWLVDRALVSDLLVRYARLADDGDFAGIADLFTPEGEVVSPLGSFPGREFGEHAPALMSSFCGTHHMITNHAIEVDGDRATSRSYLQAIHRTEPTDPSAHADLGGWYDHDFVRTAEGWAIRRMVLTFVWAAGEPFPARASS